MAFDDGILIGGLVAYFISDTEVEIRHIAVRDNMRGNAVGRSLVERLISLLSSKSANKITVNARSTSEGFYAKLGFVLVGERFEHHLFTKYGISIQPMYLKL
jgi:N-acetylglutamate synthase-like GNAT family acetyltransferase